MGFLELYLFIKSRARVHVQFAAAWNCAKSLCHPCTGRDWQCHGVGRMGNPCPGYASTKLGGATYSFWTHQNTFSSIGLKDVPEILVWQQARLGGRKGRGFAKVCTAWTELKAEPSAVTQVCSLCLLLKVSHKKKKYTAIRSRDVSFVRLLHIFTDPLLVCGGYCSAADDCAVIHGCLKSPGVCFGSFLYLLFT